MKLSTLSLSLLTALTLGSAACGGSQTVSDAVDVARDSAESHADEAALRAVIASPHRSDANKARDTYRHPMETLSFFGLKSDLSVIEIGPGRGWYAEILAPFLAARGQYIAALHDPEGPRANYRAGWNALVEAHPETFGNVPTVTFDPGSKIDLGSEQVDLILTFRNAHSWVSAGVAEEAFAGLFAGLKSGGHLGLVSHRAPAGSDPAVTSPNGYVAEQVIIDLAKTAGFELVASSEINANPKDTTDHANGVWSLLPTLRGDSDEEKARNAEIGESDRMTLLFRKP